MTYWNPEEIQLLQTAEAIVDEHTIFVQSQLMEAENHRLDTVYVGSVSSVLLSSAVAMEYINPSGWTEYPYDVAHMSIAVLAFGGIVSCVQAAYHRHRIIKRLVE